MIINTNIGSLNAQRNLTGTNGAMQKSLEKLSSGYRINKAADDAAGLAISEKMRAQIKGLNQAQRNAQDGISLIQTAEGALNETHSILQRMRELTIQASNGTNQTEDKTAIKNEMDQLLAEIDGISSRTQFNGKNLLNGSFGNTAAASGFATVADISSLKVGSIGNGAWTAAVVSDGTANATLTLTNGSTVYTSEVFDAQNSAATPINISFKQIGLTFTLDQGQDATNLNGTTLTVNNDGPKLQIGANTSQTLSLGIGDMSQVGLNLEGTDVSTAATSTAFDAILTKIDTAINTVSSQRSTLGAWQNRLEHTINNLATASENLSAAQSRIRDVDMAKEMSEFTKNQVLSQAGVAMLAQANQTPQAVLKLLG